MATGGDRSSHEGSHSSHHSHRSRDNRRHDLLDDVDEEDEVLRSDNDPNESRCAIANIIPTSPIDPMTVNHSHLISCVRNEGISIPSDTMDPFLLGQLKHASLLSFLRQGFGVVVRDNECKDALIRQIIRMNVNILRHHQSRDKQRIEDLEKQIERLTELLVSTLADKHQGDIDGSERPLRDREVDHRNKQHKSRSKSKTSYERSADSHQRHSYRHSSDNIRAMSVPVSQASRTSQRGSQSQREVDVNIADLQHAFNTIPQTADISSFMDDLVSLFQQTGIPQVERYRQIVELINKTAQTHVQSENLVPVTAEVSATQSEPSRREERRPGMHVAGKMLGMLHSLSKKMRKPFIATTVTTVPSAVTNAIVSTVSTERVARSSPVTMPEHCAAVERTTGLLPIPPCFDVSELSTSTPLSDHEVLPRGLVQNKSRIAYHHRLEQDRSVSDSHRSRHRRCGRFVRDAPAREAGIVQRRGKLPMDVELSVSSFSSSSSTSSPESDDYEITSDYTYVPSNERSHYTSKHGSDSLNIHSGLEHTSCQFVPGHSRRSRRQRRESFIGSRKTDKMLKAVAQLQLGLQAQIDALVDQNPQVEQFGPFYWKNVRMRPGVIQLEKLL